MVVTLITKGFSELNKKLNDATKTLKNPRAFNAKASVLMFKDVMQHFKDEKDSSSQKWPSTKRGGRILQDTGRLKNSIITFSDNKVAQVGTNVIYSRVHNEGWPERNIPKREYMYLSKEKDKEIADLFVKELEGAIK